MYIFFSNVIAECCSLPTGAIPLVWTGPLHSRFYRSNTNKSLSQYFPSPPPKTYIWLSITLAVWNCLIGASPLIILGMLNVNLSKVENLCQKFKSLPTPFLRSMKITSERTENPFHPPYIIIWLPFHNWLECPILGWGSFYLSTFGWYHWDFSRIRVVKLYAIPVSNMNISLTILFFPSPSRPPKTMRY